MNLLPTSQPSAVAQRVRRGARSLGGWLQRHRSLASWFVWGVFVLLCVAWVQRYYQPPAGLAWFGKTLRVLVFALVALIVREWLALRWEADVVPTAQRPSAWEDTDRDEE